MVLLIGLAACARTTVAHTHGEIPRDTYGKPVWSLIAPPGAPTPNR
jgi:hypothetical protein